jgi:hypothetical protein
MAVAQRTMTGSDAWRPRRKRVVAIASISMLIGLLVAPTAVLAGTVIVTRASLSAGNLSIAGQGAGARATVTVSSPESTATGRAGRSGAFQISASGFRSSTCKATVSDGTSSTEAILAGCTPAPPSASTLSVVQLSHASLETVGSLAVGEVLLTSAVATATSITVTSSHPALAVVAPASVTVQAGSVQGVFTVTYATQVAAPTVVTISAAGGGVTKTTSLTLNPQPPVGISPSGPLGPGFVGSDFTTFATLPTTLALGPGALGPARFVITAGQLPAGLSLRDTNTSQTPAKHIDISVVGTPTTVGTSSFTLRGTDANGQTATGTYTITVNPARTIAINPQLPWSPTVGSFANLWLDASGGVAPYRWTVAAGQLPPGMSLLQDVATGPLVRITGTPTTAGTFTFTLRLTDSAGATVSRVLTVVVT